MITIRKHIVTREENAIEATTRILKKYAIYVYNATDVSVNFRGQDNITAHLEISMLTPDNLDIYNVSDEIFERICNDFSTYTVKDMCIILHRTDTILQEKPNDN